MLERTAILVVDRQHLVRMLAEVHVAAFDVAKTHDYRLVKMIALSNPDLGSILDFIGMHDITALITPTMKHVGNNTGWVRTRCDLLTMFPPSFAARQQRQMIRR